MATYMDAKETRSYNHSFPFNNKFSLLNKSEVKVTIMDFL